MARLEQYAPRLSPTGGLCPRRERIAKQLILANLGESLAIADLAQACALSRSRPKAALTAGWPMKSFSATRVRFFSNINASKITSRFMSTRRRSLRFMAVSKRLADCQLSTQNKGLIACLCCLFRDCT